MLLTHAADLLCLQLHTAGSQFLSHFGGFHFALSYLSLYMFVWFEVNTALLIKIRLI